MKEVSHPKVNYFIKHIGHIFRRTFALALDDVKTGETFSSTLQLVPTGVEGYMSSRFDDELWALMETVADKTHCALEPMYGTVDPDLPTFVASPLDRMKNEEELFVRRGDGYVKTRNSASRSPGAQELDSGGASHAERALGSASPHSRYDRPYQALWSSLQTASFKPLLHLEKMTRPLLHILARQHLCHRRYSQE